MGSWISQVGSPPKQNKTKQSNTTLPTGTLVQQPLCFTVLESRSPRGPCLPGCQVGFYGELTPGFARGSCVLRWPCFCVLTSLLSILVWRPVWEQSQPYSSYLLSTPAHLENPSLKIQSYYGQECIMWILESDKILSTIGAKKGAQVSSIYAVSLFKEVVVFRKGGLSENPLDINVSDPCK